MTTNPVRHLRNDRHIVGDEQDGHMVFALQPVDERGEFPLEW